MDNTDPLVSIIVPSYNQGIYLDECLQSVSDQTYQQWECIIINDGSVDNTEEVAQKWIKKDHRYSYFSIPNGGVSNARNIGVEKSSGTYILPLDGDDKIACEYIEKCIIEFSQDPTLGIIYTEAYFFGKINEKWDLKKEFSLKELLLNNYIYCSAVFLKEDFYKIDGYDTHMKYGLEDWEFWINFLKTTNKKAKQISYNGFYYRIKEVSRNQMIGENYNQLKEMKDYIFNKHKDTYMKHFSIIDELNNNKYKSSNDIMTNKLNNLYKYASFKYLLINLFKKIFSK